MEFNETFGNIEREFTESGYRCCTRHIGIAGRMWRTGYVMLSPNHPWAGFKDELDMPEETWEIHGGITFYEKHRDCTVIGWDANHSFDDENPFTADETESETRRLARMCAKVKV